MGWKLQAGIAAAVVIGIVLFRDQIKGLLSGAGAALGEGIGGAGGQFITGIGRGFAAPLEAAIGPAGSRGEGFFEPGGFFFSGPLGQIIQPAYGEDFTARDNANDRTVTPNNREQSDTINIRSRILQRTFSYPKVSLARTQEFAAVETRAFKEAYQSVASSNIGHAAKTRQAASISGVPTPRVTFEALRQAALREGKTPSEARRLAFAAVR